MGLGTRRVTQRGLSRQTEGSGVKNSRIIELHDTNHYVFREEKWGSGGKVGVASKHLTFHERLTLFRPVGSSRRKPNTGSRLRTRLGHAEEVSRDKSEECARLENFRAR